MIKLLSRNDELADPAGSRVFVHDEHAIAVSGDGKDGVAGRVLGALDTPVPYSPPLEASYLPSDGEIERAREASGAILTPGCRGLPAAAMGAMAGAFRAKARGRDFVPDPITRLPTLSAAELKMDAVEDPRAGRFIGRV